MKTISETVDSFWGECQGYDVHIEREEDGRFYIQVIDGERSFGTAYDGYAPVSVTTMQKAKAEALRGAMITAELPNDQ